MGFMRGRARPGMKAGAATMLAGAAMVAAGLAMFLAGQSLPPSQAADAVRHGGTFVGLLGIGAAIAGLLLGFVGERLHYE